MLAVGRTIFLASSVFGNRPSAKIAADFRRNDFRHSYRFRMDAPIIPAPTATIIKIRIQLASRKVTIGFDEEPVKNIVTEEGSAFMVSTPLV